MTKSKRAATRITRKGTVRFEVFKISTVVSPEQRKLFRANKAEFFRKLFEDASHKVNSMSVTRDVDRELNALVAATPKTDPIPINLYVYHVIQSSGILYKVSDHIVSKERLLTI